MKFDNFKLIANLQSEKCLVCGKESEYLNIWHLRIHKLNYTQYCKKYNLNIKDLNWIKFTTCVAKENLKNIKERCLNKYGVDNPRKIDYVIKKIRRKKENTLLKKYGVKNSYQIPEIKQKIKGKREKTLLKKYGVTCSYRIPRILEKARKSLGNKHKINKEESLVLSLDHRLKYRKIGSFRVKINKTYYDPDFTVEPIEITKKLVEYFGYPWHYPKFTKQSLEEHEKQKIDYYKKAGYKCLVIWSHELDKLENIKQKIKNFIES